MEDEILEKLIKEVKAEITSIKNCVIDISPIPLCYTYSKLVKIESESSTINPELPNFRLTNPLKKATRLFRVYVTYDENTKAHGGITVSLHKVPIIEVQAGSLDLIDGFIDVSYDQAGRVFNQDSDLEIFVYSDDNSKVNFGAYIELGDYS